MNKKAKIDIIILDERMWTLSTIDKIFIVKIIPIILIIRILLCTSIKENTDNTINTNNIDNIEFDILLEDSYWNLKGHPWEHKTEKIKVEL